jgi:hypothetical protein
LLVWLQEHNGEVAMEYKQDKDTGEIIMECNILETWIICGYALKHRDWDTFDRIIHEHASDADCIDTIAECVVEGLNELDLQLFDNVCAEMDETKYRQFFRDRVTMELVNETIALHSEEFLYGNYRK